MTESIEIKPREPLNGNISLILRSSRVLSGNAVLNHAQQVIVSRARVLDFFRFQYHCLVIASNVVYRQNDMYILYYAFIHKQISGGSAHQIINIKTTTMYNYVHC